MRYDPNGNVSWWKIGAIALVASGIIIGTALTIATFGAASVAGTIAISSAITFAAKAAEVTTLQIKKSVADGDDNDDIFNDVVDAIVGNAPKIIGLTSITKTGGYSIGIYNQSNLFYEIKDLMKYDGFNLNNLACGSIYALKERFQNVEQYMSMKTSISGYVISYVFAAIAVGNLIYSIFSEDYLELARKRKYKLY